MPAHQRVPALLILKNHEDVVAPLSVYTKNKRAIIQVTGPAHS